MADQQKNVGAVPQPIQEGVAAVKEAFATGATVITGLKDQIKANMTDAEAEGVKADLQAAIDAFNAAAQGNPAAVGQLKSRRR
jgi:hypothetical protein